VKGSRGRKSFITTAERIRNIALHVLCSVRLAANHTTALRKIRNITTCLLQGFEQQNWYNILCVAALAITTSTIAA